MELKRMIVVLVLVSILLATFTVLPSVGKPEVMGPNMDAIKFVTVAPMMQPAKLMEGVIDVATVSTLEDWEELEAWGAHISTYPSLSFGFYDFNVAREKLQDRYLRRAMAWLTNVDLAIATSPVLGVLVKRTYSWLPDVYGPWHNPNVEKFYSYITAPGDPASVNAINEMIAGGYTAVKIDDAKPVERGNIDHWEKDGMPLPTFNLVYTADWPENKVFAEAWVAELVAHGFDILPECIAFYPTWINRIIWGDPPDYDLTLLDTTWSKIDPIIMDLYFNSERMPPGACCNWRRWNSSLADSLIETFTTTTNMTKAYKACWDLQDLVASEAIMPAQIVWNTVTAYHPDLMGVRKSAVITDWTLSMFQMKWKTPEARAAHMNTLIYPQVGEPEDLNPNKQAGVWASWLVGLLTDSYGGGFGLTVYDPVSMEMKPWGAYDWKVEEYTEGPITGTKITYWLQDDIYWQDHTPENPRPFTADDVKFCLEYLQASGSAGGQAATATKNLVNVTVKDVGTSSTDPTLDGWNEAIVYHNTTSPFLLYYTSAWAMELPKHIWEAVPPAEAIAATPWTEPHPIYNTANPHPIHGPLTKLIGTGPFVFLDGAWTPDQETFTANRIYYRSAEASLADINFDFKVDMHDLNMVTDALGSKVGDPEYSPNIDINYDGAIDDTDVSVVEADLGKTWGGLLPFTFSNLAVSPSEVETGEESTITATVENEGDYKGTYQAILKIDGHPEVYEDVTLEAGESTTVTFKVSKDEAGTYNIEVGGQTATLTVSGLAPAKFSVTSLSVSPLEVGTGENATVTVTVENTGDVLGEYTVELNVNGETEDTKEVTLDGGESTTVTFKVSKDEAGTYDIEVGGKTETITVTALAPPTTPYWLYAGIIVAIIVIVAIWRWRARERRS